MYDNNENHLDTRYRRGDILIIDFGTHENEQVVGYEVNGVRPAVVVSNDYMNFYGDNLVVAPLTDAMHKDESAGIATHIFISTDDVAIKKDSVIMLEKISSVSKQRVVHYATSINKKQMKRIDKNIGTVFFN